MTKKIILKISGMHCVSCAMNIDGELEDTEGVKKSVTNYAREQTEVEFDVDTTTPERLKNIIKKVGYSASIIQ